MSGLLETVLCLPGAALGLQEAESDHPEANSSLLEAWLSLWKAWLGLLEPESDLLKADQALGERIYV